MRVVLMGQGRLGSSLLPLLLAAGVEVRPWRRGEALPPADVYWLCVKDAAIPEVARLPPPDAVLLHASGALGPEVLGERAERGLLHPLMTFPGPAIHLPELRGVAARIDGSPGARAAAGALAAALGLVPLEVPGDVRLYHAAATLASNHVAAVFLDAAATLAAAGVEPTLARAALARLAHESLDRVAAGGPAALTGPGARGDLATLDAHRAALDPALRPAYDAVAARIARLVGR